jgi:hypothetical protein
MLPTYLDTLLFCSRALHKKLTPLHRIRGDFMKLNLDRDFYIGGVPHVEDGLVVHENFTGCIENMYLNHSNVIAAFKDQFGYEDDFYRYGVTRGCQIFLGTTYQNCEKCIK